MSTKLKVMLMVTISVLAICVTAVVVILLPPCKYCGDKFCMERCVVFYEGGDTVSRPGATGLKAQNQKTNQKTTRLAETTRAKDSYINDLYFIGDSRMIGLMANAGLAEDHVFAEDGLNHEAALTKPVARLQEFKSVTIAEAITVTVPDVVVVGFGINGIVWMNNETFMEGYEQMVDQLITASPTSIIVIQSINPVSIGYENRSDGVTNERIDEVNELLYAMAEEKGLYYLATNEVLKNETNDLPDSLHNGDGIHYNKAAYDLIVDYILSHPIYKTH